MIKKILSAFLMIFVSGIANANIHIDGKVARKIVLEHIDQEHQVPALQEYNVQLKATGNFTMSAAGLYKVCTAARWDIATPDGKTKCENFVKALVAESDYKYYAACDKKYKDNKNYKCIDNVFYHWYTVADTQVTMLQADGLCKEYAKVKFKDDIECNIKPRKMDQNEYVQCTSKLNPTYYEFKFDDVEENKDAKIQNGVMESLCTIYDLKYQKSIGTTDASGNVNMTVPYCETKDANICKKISESGKRFNYYAEIRTGNFYGSGYCGFYQTNKIYSQKDLQTAYGIKNDIFYNGKIQTQGSKDLKDALKRYVAKTIEPEQLKEFDCNDNAVQIGSIRGKSDNDDVLTCYANGKRIDFVFDDLSEAWRFLYDNSTKEIMECTIAGGLYSGKRCLNVGEEACKKIAQSTFLVQGCPECSKLYWDGNICTLPAAATANALDKGMNIAMIVGGAVLNVYITIQTGGFNSVAGGVVFAVETLGSAIEFGTEISMDLAADTFFVESNKCNNKDCARSLINEHLQRLANFYNRLTEDEIKAVDIQMAKLFKLIPAEELFTMDALIKVDQKENNGAKLASFKDNQKGFFDPKSWEPEHILQAVGITMQFTGLAYQIWNKLFSKSNKTAKVMTEVADVLDDKADEAMKAMAKNSDGTVNALKQKQLLTDKWISNDNEILKLMDRYNIDAIPEDPTELKKLFDKHQDLRDLFKKSEDIADELTKLKHNNPGIWAPGEDVAQYYDYKKVQQKFAEIDAEEAEYLASLTQKDTELSDAIRKSTFDTRHTPEQQKTIQELEHEIYQRKTLLTEDMDPDKLVPERGSLMESILKEHEAELEKIKKEEGYHAYFEAQRKILNENPGYQEVYKRYKDADNALIKKRLALEKEDPVLKDLSQKLNEARNTYSEEYIKLVNENEFNKAVLDDTRKTIGDKKNVVWWDAIPQEIKEKYAEFMDEQMVQMLSDDPSLAYSIKNFDVVSGNPELYSDFVGQLNKKLNEYVFDPNNASKIKMSSYDDAISSTGGWHRGTGEVAINRLNSMNQSVDGTIGTVKHEVLGHHIDQVMPNYGLQGETMQNYIKSTDELGRTKYLSHGNADQDIITAKSPILGTEFSISDASEAAQKALENEGFVVRSVSDPDSYMHYRNEMSEQEAWLLTPTSNTAEKVEENFIGKYGVEIPKVE